MNRLLIALLVVPSLTPSLPALGAEAEINLKEGAWNITLQQDPPSAATLPVIQMICLTRSEPLPRIANNDACRLLTRDVQGDTVFWVEECRQPGLVTRSVGNATFSGTRVEGGIQSTLSRDGAPPEMRTIRLSGRRQGACR